MIPQNEASLGQESQKKYISTLIFGKQVKIHPVTKDRYGRTVAHITGGSLSISHEMVRSGNAWGKDEDTHHLRLSQLIGLLDLHMTYDTSPAIVPPMIDPKLLMTSPGASLAMCPPGCSTSGRICRKTFAPPWRRPSTTSIRSSTKSSRCSRRYWSAPVRSWNWFHDASSSRCSTMRPSWWSSRAWDRCIWRDAYTTTAVEMRGRRK